MLETPDVEFELACDGPSPASWTDAGAPLPPTGISGDAQTASSSRDAKLPSDAPPAPAAVPTDDMAVLFGAGDNGCTLTQTVDRKRAWPALALLASLVVCASRVRRRTRLAGQAVD